MDVKKRIDWNHDANLAFLDVWEEYFHALRRNFRKNAAIYDEMATQLNEVLPSSMGAVCITRKIVSNKIDNFQRKFRLEKYMVSQNGGAPSQWQYYDRVAAIIQSPNLNNYSLVTETSVGSVVDRVDSPDIVPSAVSILNVVKSENPTSPENSASPENSILPESFASPESSALPEHSVSPENPDSPDEDFTSEHFSSSTSENTRKRKRDNPTAVHSGAINKKYLKEVLSQGQALLQKVVKTDTEIKNIMQQQLEEFKKMRETQENLTKIIANIFENN